MATQPRTRRRKPDPGDSARRIIRTAIQLGIASMLLQGFNLFFPGRLSADQMTWLTGLVGLLVSATQNVLEDTRTIPAMLKTSPPPEHDTQDMLIVLAREIGELKAQLTPHEPSTAPPTSPGAAYLAEQPFRG